METASERTFKKYEYLAEIYANKLYSYECLGWDKQDVIQELKVKIWKAIKAYGRSYNEYLKTGMYKPMPLEVYLKTSLKNKIKDIIKKIDRKHQKVAVERLDVGEHMIGDLDTDFDKMIIGGIDLLQGLEGVERMIFKLYCKGFSMTKVSETFKNKIPKSRAKKIIKDQMKKLNPQVTKYLAQSYVEKYVVLEV